ncbi:MAG: putative beta-lysine N-acetyltransferase [Bacteroidales bacterium]
MPETVLQSTLSHDTNNSRVYVMHIHPDDMPELIPHIETLASQHQYGKLIVKSPTRYVPTFLAAGYRIEAVIPGFYKSEEDGFFLVKYLISARQYPEIEALKQLDQMLCKAPNPIPEEADHRYRFRALLESDCRDMAGVFSQVFASYPFPIHDPTFLAKSLLEDGTRYFGAFFEDKLVAISSAECALEELHAEMTDFAVLPEHRGKRLAIHLLRIMESELKKDGYKTLYTIARLHEPAMNKTFYNQGYRYVGTLHRNTQIAGKIESMNVWYRSL